MRERLRNLEGEDHIDGSHWVVLLPSSESHNLFEAHPAWTVGEHVPSSHSDPSFPCGSTWGPSEAPGVVDAMRSSCGTEEDKG